MTESLRVQDAEPTPAPLPAETGPGRRLSEARQGKSLTVAKVAQQLHLDPRLVEALEGNDYEHLPEPIYVSGYLRNYARLLGLPEEEIVGAYHQLDRPSPPILSELTRNAPRRPSVNQSAIQWGAVALVGIGLIVFGWQMSGKNEPPPAVADRGSDISPGPAAPPPAARQAAAVPGTTLGKPPGNTSAPAPDADKTGGDSSPLPDATQDADRTPATAMASADAAPAPATPTATISLNFVDDSWVEVTDATGARVFYDLGEAGQTRTVQGTPPFKVLLGYSPGVSIEYNGEAFDQSRFTSRNNVARFTLGR